MLFLRLILLPLRVYRCPRTDPLLTICHPVILPSPSEGHHAPNRALLCRNPEPKHSEWIPLFADTISYLTSPLNGIGDHGNCFFHVWFDAWALTRFPMLHQDVSQLRKAVKQWLCGNYDYLLKKGIIDAWLQEYPDIANTIESEGSRQKSATRAEWMNFCNAYALTGYRPRGTQQQEMTTRALLWHNYIRLDCTCTLDWISRLSLCQTLQFSAPSIWCSILHLSGNISRQVMIRFMSRWDSI